MICAIHQPQYLPWLGYFDKVAQADIFVILDDVQYKKNEWQNRNKIKTAQGWQWLTVPVIYKFGEKINQVKINNQANWRKQHYQSLSINYKKASYFVQYDPFFKQVYEQSWDKIVDINVYLLKHLLQLLKINTRLIRSSELGIKTASTERLVDICKSLKADTYLSGIGGRDYLDLPLFSQNNISVIFQEYKHPEYVQLYNKFEPFMSVVDLLFNHGQESISILMKR